MNSNITPILIGNAFRENSHGGHGYDIFHENGICRCLNAASGGGGTNFSYDRRTKDMRNPHKSIRRQACCNRSRGGGIANCITSVQKDSMVLEPAILTTERTEEAKELRRKQGDKGAKFSKKQYTIRQNDMSNTITTVQKDNLLVEPQVIQKVGDRGTENYSVHDYANTIPANPMSDRGQLLVEPIRVRTATALGYDECSVGRGLDAAYPNSKLRRGRVQDNGDVVGAITSQGDAHCVYEGRTIAYKEMPNGNIRAYDPNTADKRGISESQITNPKNESPTITTAQTPKVMEQQPMYRIRKLTPVETGRLMGIDDADIHKMLDPVDDKGKPIISKSQAYKLHGNSIVVDVLYHIFRKMFIDTESTQPQQLTLF